jgi:hypothetical protein
MSQVQLLIYPEVPDTFWSFKHALKFVRKKAGAPSLGLLTVAAMLPSEWEKRLVDLNVTSLTQTDLAASSARTIGSAFSGRCSAVPGCSRWPSRWPSTASISARWPRCTSVEQDLDGCLNPVATIDGSRRM